VYLVGGPVRDTLLGAPLKDLDFAVEGDAPAVARELADEVGGRALIHPQFGTATVLLADCRVDLATARQELYSHPGALPQVAPGAIYDDLSRRDFSINCLALPLAERHPQVLDPHGGVGDLEQGVIRTLHRNSFVDDATRIFRAVRYEQRLGFRIEEETLAQLQDAINQGYLATISGDRIRHELERIFHEERPDLALQRAGQLGILAAVHPSLGHAFGVLPHFDPDCIGAPGEGTEPLAYLACLVYHLSPEEGESVAHRLNLPRPWAEVVRDAIQLRQRGTELAAPALSRSQVWRLVEGLTQAAVLAATRLSDSPLAAQRLEQYLKELRFIVPALNGRDLLELGVHPGPLVGQILDQLRTAKLDRQVSTEEEERRLVRKLLATQGG
jgi:tRNA nucleotidyltransferase (CCA-adding enzyme)